MPDLCRDLPEVTFTSERTRIPKKEGQRGLAAFVPWIKGQADGWCSVGLCANGACHGHLRDLSVTLLEETAEYIEVRFSTKIFCRCDGESLEPATPTETTSTPSGSGSSSSSSPASGTTPGGCPCTRAEENAEYAIMMGLYRDAVNNARALGYQAGNDAGYSDPGLGFHKVGNCADWQQVSWSALVTRTWKCWRIQKIRARMHWTALTFHHFVKLEAICSGRIVFLDPWPTGKPDAFEADKFEFNSGWSHTVTHTHNSGDRPRDPGND